MPCRRPEGRPAATSIICSSPKKGLFPDKKGNLPSEGPTRRPSDPRRGWAPSYFDLRCFVFQSSPQLRYRIHPRLHLLFNPLVRIRRNRNPVPGKTQRVHLAIRVVTSDRNRKEVFVRQVLHGAPVGEVVCHVRDDRRDPGLVSTDRSRTSRSLRQSASSYRSGTRTLPYTSPGPSRPGDGSSGPSGTKCSQGDFPESGTGQSGRTSRYPQPAVSGSGMRSLFPFVV